jgi:hypothetical protein
LARNEGVSFALAAIIEPISAPADKGINSFSASRILPLYLFTIDRLQRFSLLPEFQSKRTCAPALV